MGDDGSVAEYSQDRRLFRAAFPPSPFAAERPGRGLEGVFAELPQWVTLKDEREVAEFFGVSRHHVHEVLMGRRTGYAVLAALTSHGSENRKRGIRRPDLSPEATARKTLQLALEFANETKEG